MFQGEKKKLLPDLKSFLNKWLSHKVKVSFPSEANTLVFLSLSQF